MGFFSENNGQRAKVLQTLANHIRSYVMSAPMNELDISSIDTDIQDADTLRGVLMAIDEHFCEHHPYDFNLPSSRIHEALIKEFRDVLSHDVADLINEDTFPQGGHFKTSNMELN